MYRLFFNNDCINEMTIKSLFNQKSKSNVKDNLRDLFKKILPYEKHKSQKNAERRNSQFDY